MEGVVILGDKNGILSGQSNGETKNHPSLPMVCDNEYVLLKHIINGKL